MLWEFTVELEEIKDKDKNVTQKSGTEVVVVEANILNTAAYRVFRQLTNSGRMLRKPKWVTPKNQNRKHPQEVEFAWKGVTVKTLQPVKTVNITELGYEAKKDKRSMKQDNG
jgi:hypothetical protein